MTEEIKASDWVTRILENSQVFKGNQIVNSWRSILESIKSSGKNGSYLGQNLAAHSRIVDLKNGILLVEADHSTWLQILQVHQKYVLGCIQRRFPDLNIQTLAFKIRGAAAALSSSYEESLRIAREQTQRRYDFEEKYFKEQGLIKEPDLTPDEAYKKLPPELQQLFDRLKKDIAESGENL